MVRFAPDYQLQLKAEEKPLTFSDVTEDDWYYTAVMAMAEKKAVNGYSDGAFRPNNNISRAEVAVILYRLAGSPETETAASFFDVKAEPCGVSFASRWADCCRVAEEILRHKEILLAPDSRLVNDAALGKLVSARLYSLADYDALLVVNAAASAQTVALPMNGLRGDSAQAIMGDAPVVEGGCLKISLRGLGCSLIRINECKRKGLSR